MSLPALHVRRLTVRRMYGAQFDGLRATDLCDGLNVVYGPNGAGKTTLARALQALLWPGLDGVGRAALEGRFALDEADWHVALDGSSIHYQCDGQHTSAPTLPDPDRRDRYYLHLHELLHAEADGDAFARIIRREAIGGVDVRQAAAALGFKQPAPRTGSSTAAVREAQARLHEVERRQQRLQHDEQRLADLRRRRNEAHTARARCEALHLALDARRARDEHNAARRTLSAFPDVMYTLRGDEPHRLAELRDARAQARADRADAERRLAEVERTIASNRIPDEALPDGLIDRGARLVQQAEEAERTAARAERERAGTRRRAKEAWAHVEGAVDEAAAAELDVAAVGELIGYVQRAGQTRAQQRAMAAMERLFGDARASTSAEAHRDAIRYLQNWLAHARGGSRLAPQARRLVVATALMLVAGAIASALLLHPVGWALLLPAGLLAYVIRLLGGASESDQDLYRHDFERLPVDPPDAWTLRDVRDRLDELYARRADDHVQAERAQQWENAAGERSALKHDAEQLREQREALAARLGLAPDLAEEQLHYFIEHLLAWQQAQRDAAALDAERQAARADVQQRLQHLHDLLAPYGFGPAADAAEAGAQLRVLERAASELQRALDLREEAHDAVGRHGATVADCDEHIDALFAELDLDRDDDAALHALCRRHDAYRDAREACTRAQALADRSRRRLSEHPLFEADLLDASEPELQQRLHAAETLADTAPDLADQIARIEQRIDDARSSHDLEDARAAVHEAVDDLADEREHDYRLAAGHVLAEHLHRRTRDHDRPAVFRRAQTLFADITRGRYRLDLDDEHDAFRAYDNVLERGLALGALSSGTRVQLLLAVRVAFVEQQEQGCRLPLVLDETLANSDDERAAAIMDAVLALCRTGRQIFYFTAQHDEVAKWHSATAGRDDVACRFIPLAGAPAPDAIDASALPARVAPTGLPSPDGLTHAAYGARLDVPRWDATRPVGALHLWYVVEEPAVLHTLLQSGITTWGQLRHVLETDAAASVGLEEDAGRRAVVLARALDAWRDAWRIGRGRPVDRAVLEASGAVSDAFIDEVAALADDCDGDAGRLLAALERQAVAHWRGAKTEALRTYLLAHGYLDDAEPLPDEELWARVLGAVGREMEAAGVDADALERLFERVRNV